MANADASGFINEDWRDLLLTVDGKPRERSARNALVFFEHHPEVGPSLGYNTFTQQALAVAALPWDNHGIGYPRPLTDEDAIRGLGWLECQALYKLSSSTTWQAIVSVAKRRQFNPLVDWLQGIVWDKQPRIDNWMSYYLGIEPSSYVTSVSAKFLISAVARAFYPGCKVDTMPVFEGEQGIKKSTAMRTLFGKDYYSDELAEFGSKDAGLQMQGKWCIEIAELATFGRSDIRRVKEVLSRQVDRFRAPYDRVVAEHPRQCVFAGTTNPVDGYFKDPTGGRRFWPLTCRNIDIEALEHDRDQIWAEAVARYEAKEQWWLLQSEIPAAKEEQASRMESDPWDDKIADYLSGRTQITVSELMTTVLSMPIKEQEKGKQMRVTGILAQLGWERKKKRQGHDTKWIWQRKESVLTFEVGTEGGNAQDDEF